MSKEFSTYRDGEETAKGWKARKLYLSDAAIAVLMEHCRGTPLTMSAYVNDMILSGAYEEARKVIDEGQRQIAELTAPPRTITTQDGTKLPVADRKTFVVPDGYEAVFDADGRATGETRPIKKQPTKKDFKIDI